ncbi:unnamed protein product, partial [Cyprideis torosa]
ASLPQLKAAISELQKKGLAIPSYPDEVEDDRQRDVQRRYGEVLGSAVNPVLREGNSDRRAPLSVKAYARKHPHGMMKPWPADSRTRVATMSAGDFYHSEISEEVGEKMRARLEFMAEDGQVVLLREGLVLDKDEVIDAAVMQAQALRTFYAEQIEVARREKLLLSLHLKATMMKVSDPVLFGQCVRVYLQDVFTRHRACLAELDVDANNGIAELYEKISQLSREEAAPIMDDIERAYAMGPPLAMVDSAKGITNLHAPNNIIIDASMPVLVRDGGRMWGPDNALHDTLAMIPDSSYAPIYQEVIADCQKNGAFDPSTMGSVANVGLMAQKAEEYGSHDKTFIAAKKGSIRAVSDQNAVLLQQQVEKGDIFRMCQTKDAPIRSWVQLAVERARLTGALTLFWLDDGRAHDRLIKKKVQDALRHHDTDGLDMRILPPVQAMRLTLERVRAGEDVISVTGNVLRDYLTDLFPILELGTSARMLSVVPLMQGGGLFETGAGGSAPKHVQQFLAENHLRWDSLGEFCALVAAFEHLAGTTGNSKIKVLAQTLDRAIGVHLENGRGPGRTLSQLDNRGSHFYLGLYWAEQLANQSEDLAMREYFAGVYKDFSAKEERILAELRAVQGEQVDIGGYYFPDPRLMESAMRPSPTLNALLGLGGSVALLEAKGVSKVYRVGELRVTVLDQVDLSVTPGEFVAVCGSSGSGKTTLLTLVSGLDRPSAGSIFIDGQDIVACSEEDLAEIRNVKTGFVFQAFHLIPSLSALENVMFPAELGGAMDARQKARELMERVGLWRRRDNYPDQLSGGEKQRVAICRALVNRPKILFADEPTGNLDSQNSEDIVRLLLEMRNSSKTALVMATHSRKIAAQADRIIRLHDGRLES